MIRQNRWLLALLGCMALSSAANAQNPQVAPPQETHPQVAPPGSSQPPPEQVAPPARIPGAQNEQNLSDKLSRQQGTLHPPAVDPGIHVPAPSQAQGTMPVIPPPGSPGGNPNVVPK